MNYRSPMMLKQKLHVDFEYPVVYTTDLFSPDNPTLSEIFSKGNSRIQVFVDENVHLAFPALSDRIHLWAEAHRNRVTLLPPIQRVPGGETIKDGMGHVMDMAGNMAEAGLCRHSYVMIIGGGAVLDAAGFAASVFHRGVRQIRVPTTLLAQDDSAVGVKNGVNHNGIKNLFGSFCSPDAVIIDFDFLATLDHRDILSGIAEAYKVAAIKDAGFYRYLKDNAESIRAADPAALEVLVRKSSKLHMDHIRDGGDPFEKGSSRPLDFGHWSAHKLEAMTHNELRHGEAVAIGMALDIFCAALLELIPMAIAEDMVETLERCGLSLWHPALVGRDERGVLKILQGLEEFREHLGGDLTLAMPAGIGQCTDIHELPLSVIEKALAMLQEKAAT